MKTSRHFDIAEFQSQEAWVVFTNQTDLPWLKGLRQGFRHCFIVLHDGQHWTSIDPLASFMEVVVHNVPAEFDLISWLEERGHHTVQAPLARDIKRTAPIMLFTCVEACKRILGVHKRSILTPWQLYCHLNSTKQTIPTHQNYKGELAWEA
ncbi:MAG: hypothetical protein ACTHOO_05005 [Alcanivorax sp.]